MQINWDRVSSLYIYVSFFNVLIEMFKIKKRKEKKKKL